MGNHLRIFGRPSLNQASRGGKRHGIYPAPLRTARKHKCVANVFARRVVVSKTSVSTATFRDLKLQFRFVRK